MKEYTIYVKAGIAEHDTPSIAYAVAADGKAATLKSGVESGAVTLERYQARRHGSRDVLCMSPEYMIAFAQGFHAPDDISKPLSKVVTDLLKEIEASVDSEDRIKFVMSSAPWPTSGSSLSDDKKLEQEVAYAIKQYLLSSFKESLPEE
jgi:hypothetical protein